MKSKMQKILKEQIEKIKPSQEEMIILKRNLEEIISKLKENITKSKISAEIFVGGSFAKNTIIKKEKYDVDIFIRFNEKYKEGEIAKLMLKIVPKNSVKMHGSRDYFKIKSSENTEFEIIPTLKIKKNEDAKNITDLSYFHVNYVMKKLKKNKKLEDEIKLAKAFTHYADCYGAESYINGFSGYATELLIIYYKSLENMIKAFARAKENGKEKIIIDIEKEYKNKEDVLRNLNESKLQSPIILIDPTFRERNALASLSDETFLKFKEACRKFIKNPGTGFFEAKDKEKEFGKKYVKEKSKIITLILQTNRQAGDIAGTKLRKFYNYLFKEIERYFDIKDSLFLYDENKNIGKIMVVANAKKQILFPGPPVKMKEQIKKFRKEHKKIIIKNRQAFAYEKNFSGFSDFLDFFENKYGNVIEGMGVSEIIS